MYARIFPVAPLRFGIRKMNGYSIAWYIVFAVITGYTISFTIVGIRPCAPIPGLWIRPPPKLTCIKSYTAYIAAGINIFNDMLILSLPVHNILKLRLLPVQKVYLCGIFLLGGFVVLTSVVRIWAQTRSLDKSGEHPISLPIQHLRSSNPSFHADPLLPSP